MRKIRHHFTCVNVIPIMMNRIEEKRNNERKIQGTGHQMRAQSVCCMLYAVCGVLYAVCCLPYEVCCTRNDVCSMLYVCCSTLNAVQYSSYAVCCILYAACCMLQAYGVVCYMLYCRCRCRFVGAFYAVLLLPSWLSQALF